MIPVILESPFGSFDKAVVKENIRYGRACMRDCILRREAPFASHLLYTQPGVLNDSDPIERKLGLETGFIWRRLAKKTVVYADRGISLGMQIGIADSESRNIPVETRYLRGEWDK